MYNNTQRTTDEEIEISFGQNKNRYKKIQYKKIQCSVRHITKHSKYETKKILKSTI